MRSVHAFAPGRTELAGNHTDHQGGRAIAAALDCGIEIAFCENGSSRMRLTSDGFAPVEIEAAQAGPRETERGTTAALVRGVVDSLARAGVAVRGFDAEAASTIPSGGGLSSSAAFELALVCGLQALFCDGDGPFDTPAARADVAVQVERAYFGKPCGLLDQTAIAYGGVTTIDFSSFPDNAIASGDCLGVPESPRVSTIGFDFEEHGYALCLIDVHCDHSRYTDEYARVARDMSDVARFLGASTLSQVPEEAFLERLADVRRELGDVPALRGLHYYHEMRLVDERARALKCGDMQAFLETTRRSGASSAQYLQNVSTFDRQSQPAMVALALADSAAGPHGACRIHGGGFGGTVQAFVPADEYEAFAAALDRQLGEGSCRRYRLSQDGARVV